MLVVVDVVPRACVFHGVVPAVAVIHALVLCHVDGVAVRRVIPQHMNNKDKRK